MKHIFIYVSAFLVFSVQSFAVTYVDPALKVFFNSRATNKIRVVALLKHPQGVSLPRRYESTSVKKYLMQLHQVSFRQMAQTLKTHGQDIILRERFWINDSLALDVSPQGLKTLAQNPVVEKIYANRKIYYMKPVSGALASPVSLAGDFTYGLKDIGIDRLNAERPDIQGQGVVVGHVDTGIDGKHPALQGKIKLFFDATTGKIGEAFDRNSHGTHTTGTILGGDRSNNKIGVAPGAQVIGSAALEGYDKMLKAMQFMLDPDGNPDTPDSPRLISNSWNAEGAPDIELFYRAITAWETAGILPVFSAGNAGPNPQTITTPHEHPGVFAIAATDISGKAASFSSRGPGMYKGKAIQKPDVSAPGVKVYSAIPGGRYAEMSGTSMACPHAAGIAALLFQVNPKFTPANIREILVRTSKPVDANGNTIPKSEWNPVYGFGRLDAYSAVKLALGGGNLRQVLSFSSPFESIENALLNLEGEAQEISAPYPTDNSNWILVNSI